MDAGQLEMGVDTVAVSAASEGSSDLRSDMRVVRASGGSLTFMLEDRCLLGVGGDWGY